MFGKNGHKIEAVEVPPAMDAEEAARVAYERDKSLTRHHFEEGEHPIVRIEHLNKTFTDTPVLRDVNLDVWNGEIVVVLGPSGSGKSTMLRCINLLETPTAGHILIEDKEITGTKKTDVNMLRRDLGMVFQGFNLFPHMTALENVMVGQVKVLKKPKDEARAEAMKQLARRRHAPEGHPVRRADLRARPGAGARRPERHEGPRAAQRHDHDRRHARDGLRPRRR